MNQIAVKGDDAEISLYDNQHNITGVAIVDRDDLPMVLKEKWYLSCYGYAVRQKRSLSFPPPGYRTNFLHRLVMNAQENDEIDHINHNKLDNRKVNLRFVSHQENLHNISLAKNNTSGTTGVTLYNQGGFLYWRARLKINKHEVSLGYFKTKEEAIAARKHAELNWKEIKLKNGW